MKTNKTIKAARIASTFLPLSKKNKTNFPEVNFDIISTQIHAGIYSINNKGFFCEEIMEKKNGVWNLKSQKKIEFSGKIQISTEVEGNDFSCFIFLENGFVKTII